VLVEPGGRIITEVAAPDGLVTYACMLGGRDGTTLVHCCAPDFDHERRAAVREAVVVATEVDVPRAGRP
jgi:hypothetical protein